METLDPQGGASLDPRGIVGRIYERTTRYCYILNIQVICVKVSEKKIFLKFFPS